ncbi:leucine-zipper of insertion element IS481 [Gordonia westfalica]|uniref:Leucine-zipper of insertion element IS481 n=1 Tax=Gordonia westfalica TaxID=158898 RepID=A0A1H2HCM5_9ACTN|nr:leucine-zipper of insertion element IS481 [Gordonia westfalica]
MSHRNSPLSPTGWLRLARCVVEDGWPLRRAADRFNVSVTTAKRWADRYRDHGPAGMVDRSSRPRSCPHRTSRVVGLRVSRRWGPARIGFHLGMNVSTVHRILTRYQCVRLSWTDPATGAPVRARRREARRYERDAAGDLIHVDIKKLGRIPDGGGHRVHSRAKGTRNSSAHRDASRPAPCMAVPTWDTPTCTTPSMITPGTPIRRSWLMRERKPRPHSWRGHWLTSPRSVLPRHG